jgi:hypothetical protein
MRRISRLVVSCSMTLLLALYPAAAPVSADDSSTDQTTTSQSTPPEAPATTTPEATAPTPLSDPVPQQGAVNTGATDTGAHSTGPSQPNGADASTYTYNESTGLWENDQYTWNPTTHATTPKSPQAYSYNPTTNMWDTTDWQYNPASGSYEPSIHSVAVPPSGASIAPDSLSTLASDPDSSFSGFYDASISNNITSGALTGDALLTSNTTGGSAMSGNATAIANVLNMLQSSASFLGSGGVTTFSTDIQGDVIGDLLIDPGQIAALRATNAMSPGSLTVNAQNNGLIDNKLVVQAGSGDATVSGNTNAGSAISGTADAVANVVNVLNSSIAAGQSFLGTINIYGNLDGDILLPPGFLDSLLASNAPAANMSNVTDTSALANLANNTNVNNNVATTAASGQATANSNTSAGSASTGDALTNLTILNLSSSNIIGSNNLLVFVNVLGKWVGVILDAPAGSTAASLGGGIKQSSWSADTSQAVLDATNNNTINNDITVAAQSGDATVSNNTKAGDAKTGKATASANLANIVNSHLSLADWFGILFINVFGSWTGSFGLNTDAGNPTMPTATPSSTPSPAIASEAQVFRFVPTTNSDSGGSQQYRVEPADTGNGNTVELPQAVLASTTQPQHKSPADNLPQTNNNRQNTWIIPAAALMLGTLLLAAERLLSNRRHS